MHSHSRRRFLTLSALAAAGAASSQTPPASPANAAPAGPPGAEAEAIELRVDATDLAHRIFRFELRVPVRTGPLTLLHPLWLPGQHGPFGSVNDLAGLFIRTDAGALLPWTRDPLQPQAFRLVVPTGVQRLDIQAEVVTPLPGSGGRGRVVMTPTIVNLQWNQTLLYPAEERAAHRLWRAAIRVPSGWQVASALRPQGPSTDGWVRFSPTSLEHLIDSPVFAGAHMRRVVLDRDPQRPVVLNMVADHPRHLEASDAQLQAHRQIVTQADRLFGSRPFAHYDFLLALSDQLSPIGLEHHQSSENRVSPSYFRQWEQSTFSRELLAHEYVHSWNGKYRRPHDQVIKDFNQPTTNTLLWLYEGQTEFWGRVLAVRAGMVSVAEFHQGLALLAARAHTRAGRAWRSLQDTTNAMMLGQRSEREAWPDWQRVSSDYYQESVLIWLEADMLIRTASRARRSLDDFARAFFGGRDGDLGPRPYVFEDIVRSLNDVHPMDWSAWLRLRLEATGAQAPSPLVGIELSGWRLDFSDTPMRPASMGELEFMGADFEYSLGIRIRPSGQIASVKWNGPAFKAGLSPAVTVLAVKGERYTAETLVEALRANRQGQAPVALLVREGDQFRTINIDYRDGPRHPRLRRLDEQADRLSSLLAPRP